MFYQDSPNKNVFRHEKLHLVTLFPYLHVVFSKFAMPRYLQCIYHNVQQEGMLLK